MFSLIITIISIALVTALALATIYYGGQAFRQGGDAALAAKYINEGQQLSGAAAIVEATEGSDNAFTQAGLVTKKGLQSTIASYDDAAVSRAFLSKDKAVKAEVCAAVNEKAGLKTFPVTAGNITNYGCAQTTAADVGEVVFKY